MLRFSIAPAMLFRGRRKIWIIKNCPPKRNGQCESHRGYRDQHPSFYNKKETITSSLLTSSCSPKLQVLPCHQIQNTFCVRAVLCWWMIRGSNPGPSAHQRIIYSFSWCIMTCYIMKLQPSRCNGYRPITTTNNNK